MRDRECGPVVARIERLAIPQSDHSGTKTHDFALKFMQSPKESLRKVLGQWPFLGILVGLLITVLWAATLVWLSAHLLYRL